MAERARRIVSLHLPHLGAERARRRGDAAAAAAEAPLATAAADGAAVRLASVDAAAAAAGLAPGMALADARALRPDLLTRPADPPREAAFLQALARWAQRYTPWTAEDGADGLALDVAGCAHLFGGEAAMLRDMVDRLAAAGLTARAACADTPGAAWALARFAPLRGAPAHGGAAVSADAHATRVRSPAPPRGPRAPQPPRGSRIGAPPGGGAAAAPTSGAAAPDEPVIAPVGAARAAIGPLPAAALRLPPQTVEQLSRLGLRCVEDVARLPRGGLARRFGRETLRRLDQALGAEPEPIAVARAAPSLAVRLSLPEPIGLADDVAAGVDRLLARLCATLAQAGLGARALRLTLRRVDRSDVHVEVALARPSRDAALIAGLFAAPLEAVDAGFGIDALRLQATQAEPMAARQRSGRLEAAADAADAAARAGGRADPDAEHAMAALLSRLGGRLGFDRLTRLRPADSHIPARAFVRAAAAFSDPWTEPWPAPPGPRPLTLLRPEPAAVETDGRAPVAVRWRRRRHAVAAALGPERIAPEWWLDDPDWRDGPRDYWRVETEEGLRLWLHHTPASPRATRWSVEGIFA